MKKRLSILMTMIMLVVAVFVTVPAQTVEAKGKVKLTSTKKTVYGGHSLFWS